MSFFVVIITRSTWYQERVKIYLICFFNNHSFTYNFCYYWGLNKTNTKLQKRKSWVLQEYNRIISQYLYKPVLIQRHNEAFLNKMPDRELKTRCKGNAAVMSWFQPCMLRTTICLCVLCSLAKMYVVNGINDFFSLAAFFFV